MELNELECRFIEACFSADYAINPFKSRHAYIAGGAVRDLLAGKPLADIDVFVETWGNISCRHVSIVESVFGDNTLYFYPNTHPRAHASFERQGGDYYEESGFASYRSKQMPNINIVLVNGTVEEIIKNFPISCSRIGIGASCRNNGELVVGDKWDEFVKYNVIHYNSDTDSRYLDKIRKKYPERAYTWIKEPVDSIPF